MQYRIAKPEDLAACTACAEADGHNMAVKFEDMGGIVLLAENDDGIQGVVWAVKTGTLALADYLVVTPEYRGSGLGARLLIKGLRILKELGVRHVRSSVHVDNTAALSFHGRLGILDGPYVGVSLILGADSDD